MKKSKTRIYVNKKILANLLINITDKQHHLLKNVLRAKINDHINIFDGYSGEWISNIVSINRDKTVLKVRENIINKIQNSDIWLIFAPIKPHRMSITIQKATELGVTKIIPCITEYTNLTKIKIKNLQENAIEAAEQSERLDVPCIKDKINLESLLLNWPNDRKLIYCDEKISVKNSILKKLKHQDFKKSKFGVLVGPEGGFSDKEQKIISKNKNTISVSLGKRVLRSDTAITVSLFCIQELLTE